MNYKRITKLLLILVGLHLTSGNSHSLWYLHTGETQGRSLSQHGFVGLVDGEQFGYYNSNTRKLIPNTAWLKEKADEDYWKSQEQILQYHDEWFRENVATILATKDFNQTDGNHTWLWAYGCELDDDGTMRGYNQYTCDGEEFLSLDLNTLTWTAANSVAHNIKQKMEDKRAQAEYIKEYLENTCINHLNNNLKGCSTGQRDESSSGGRRSCTQTLNPPEGFLNQDSSPVVCHATGFFPRTVNITWKKNGEDLHENVELRETLPNQNGTFQKRSILRVSPEELKKNNYTCVVQHSGLEKELVLIVADRSVQKGGKVSDGVSFGIIVGVVVAVLLVVLIGCVGLFIWKRKTAFKPVASSDGKICSVERY